MIEQAARDAELKETTSEIVAAYVSKNSVPAGDLPGLIRSVHEALSGLGRPEHVQPPAEPLKPPVSIKKSITDDFLISMEDGKRYQSLKRHLATRGLTPAEYRAKWGLPGDYPMTAPGYSARRSELARTIGLGSKRKAPEAAAEPAPTPEPEVAEAPKKRGRAKKAA